MKGAEVLKNGVASILLAVALTLSIGLIACAGEHVQETTEYTLTVYSTDGGSTMPGFDLVCAEGTEVSIEATPEPGYRFVGWTGDVDTIADVNAPTTTIIMNDKYTVTANFRETPATYYALTLAVSGNGSTSPSVGQHTYAAGTAVPIAAAAAVGHRFVIWTGSVDTVANVIAATTTVTMNGDYSITANFEEGAPTSPGPDVGATVRGATKEEGYIFPSDLQRHSFFTGIT